ncbi:MAG: NAD(P)-dependent glycerol-3-phosphate dehydrogenase [Inhella sp.]|jgi:glycerol-3-phosphate dehydrogenase (NAD(P)+)|uniref:NAD(P)H-dependent glycerol-3-phosphate dehydrogenase n=1 Tax=Inhella sp. TaxID=1921806 RepID=UPI0022CA9F59|nr:NAD(P)H-dependent glycerol-3-phosphate dehydrogenase [Inhella sp.]MCZ8234564.1 NAD(P)-dependent glycerol-3-phosphate dehydrogenase [Inhella sp.]
MQLTVLGAGAWGTALAIQAAARHTVTLWARDAAQVAQMQSDGRNARYLPEVALPPALRLTADWDAALAGAGCIVVACPMAGLREALQRCTGATPLLWLCKGFEAGTGLLGHEIARAVGRERVGILSGPSFAQEVARGQATALVAASEWPEVAQLAVDVFHGERLRVYTSTDPVGVEVGGAVKNVMAIATGVADGLRERAEAADDWAHAPGLNARAALLTRGLAEMTRLGLALGARAETFLGLSGLGDLVLTATGDLSRNRKVGLLLAQGLPLNEVLARLGHVAEGVYSAQTVLARGEALGLDLPITRTVVDLLAARLTPPEALARLMGRDPRAEVDAAGVSAR